MPSLILRGGLVVDGSGAPPGVADVAVRGDRILAVGPYLPPAPFEVDCRGHAVAPGFIDTHSHSDLKVLADPVLPMKLLQGITLEVLGQDGISVAPVRPTEREAWRQKLSGLLGGFGVTWDWSTTGDYLDRLASARPAPDVAYLAPHGALRQCVAGGEDRRLSPTEMAEVQDLLRGALQEGACGMSTGLIYPPCCYADTAELIALGRVLAEAGRPLVVHLRSEGDFALDAIDEMLTVAAESGCPVHVSHLKLAGRENWGKLDAFLGRIEGARAAGLRVTADQYPYVAGSTLLGAILPPWAHAGGAPATLARLRDPESRARLRAELLDTRPVPWDNFWKWSGPEGIRIADIPSGRHAGWLGRSLREIAGDADPVETAFDLLEEESMGVAMISFSQDEGVVHAMMRRSWVNACTDGLLGGRPHPRAYGAFPRVLRLAREHGLPPLEETVRKLTSQAAVAFGFPDVGLLRPGMRANVVVFDPARVADLATFEDPCQHPVGIRDVVVGGEIVVREGTPTGSRPGRVRR